MSAFDIPGMRFVLPNPYLFRVNQYGLYNFTYHMSKRDALRFAQAEADVKGGEWIVAKQDRHKDYRCVKRVGPSYRATSCVPPRRR